MAPLEVTLEDLQRWLRNVDCPLNDCRAIDIPQSLELHQRRLEHLKHLVEEPAECNDASCSSETVSGGSESSSVPQSVLRHELEVVKGIVDGLRSLHSPIRRLPPELLSEIFLSCIPQDDNLDTPKPYEAPLLLGQVCGYWREVSLSTPSLWSSFDLVIRDPDLFPEPSIPTINQRRVALFNLWLSRSAAHPFTLHLNDYSHDGDVSGAILTQHFGRFRSLRLVVPTADSRPSFPTSGTFPFLRSFEIRTPYGLHPGTMTDVSNLLLNHAPNLRTFIWINFTNHQHSGIKLRWSNLTRLTLNASVSVAQCLAIMSEAQELTHLTFQDICIPSYPTSSSSLFTPGGPSSGYGQGQSGHITLYHLAVLVIRVYEPFSPFFDAITLPALKEMVLNTRQGWDHASFMGFLDRSKCPLETFNLYFPPIKPAELVQCLEKVQGTLKEFTVQGDSWLEPCITDDIMDQLTNFADVPDHQVDSDDPAAAEADGDVNSLSRRREHGGTRLRRPILCPNVEVIALYDCMSCTHGRFTEMARSRLVHRPPPGLVNRRLSSSSQDDLGFCVDVPQSQHSDEGTSQVARLKVLELYNNEPEIELLKELRHLGLVLKIYSESDGSPIELDQEDADTLKKLRDEGLVLRVYQASTGHFGIAD